MRRMRLLCSHPEPMADDGDALLLCTRVKKTPCPVVEWRACESPDWAQVRPGMGHFPSLNCVSCRQKRAFAHGRDLFRKHQRKRARALMQRYILIQRAREAQRPVGHVEVVRPVPTLQWPALGDKVAEHEPFHLRWVPGTPRRSVRLGDIHPIWVGGDDDAASVQ